jgi:hypothetical protein
MAISSDTISSAASGVLDSATVGSETGSEVVGSLDLVRLKNIETALHSTKTILANLDRASIKAIRNKHIEALARADMFLFIRHNPELVEKTTIAA